MQRLTEAELMALDGLALTRLAWHRGLAPAGVQWDEGWLPEVETPCWADGGILGPSRQPWHPHEDLVQADALLRRLRKKGSVGLETLAGNGAEGGWYEVGYYGGLYAPRIYWGPAWQGSCARLGRAWEETEALAIVRVSVCATMLGGGAV